jgi:hypothetical protein
LFAVTLAPDLAARPRLAVKIWLWRYGRRMKVTRARENVFELTLKGQELSALVAGARMALDIMERDPHAPQEAIELLRGVIGDYDKALARLEGPDGRPGRPSE